MKFFMFYDAELASMNPFRANALKQVMDDKIAEKLLELFNSEEYSIAKENHVCAAVYRQFEEYIYPVVYPIRLIEDLKTKRLPESNLTYRELLYRMDMDSDTLDYVYHPQETVEEILNLLENIRENGDGIPTAYEARTKSAYEDFYREMKVLKVQADILSGMYGIPNNPNFLRDIVSNKLIFYSAGEAKRSTGFLGIASKRGKLAQIENGLKYQLYLREHSISREQGREFL